MACDPGAQRVQGVVEVCRQEQNRSEKPLHSVKRQRNKATAERHKNKTAPDGDIFAGKRLTEQQAVELGLLDLVAAVFELHVWELWWRASCREESRLAGCPNTSPENIIPTQIPVRSCHY